MPRNNLLLSAENVIYLLYSIDKLRRANPLGKWCFVFFFLFWGRGEKEGFFFLVGGESPGCTGAMQDPTGSTDLMGLKPTHLAAAHDGI